MKIGYISIGDELLKSGKVDENKNFLSDFLSNFGFEISIQITVKDDENEIFEALKFLKDYDLIVLSGGLGPTKDDRTRFGIAKFLNSNLEFHQDLWEELSKRYEKMERKTPENLKNQFLIPKKAKPLKNEIGSAPGILAKKSKKIILAFPGVPEEFNFFVLKYVEGFLKKKKKIYRRVYNLSGVFESNVEEKLKDFYEKFPSKKLNILASAGIVSIGLIEEKKYLFEKMDEEIKKIFKEEIFSFDEKKLNEHIYALLLKKNKTISIAESCTGGGLAYELVKVPGISKFLKGGAVVYSNEAKEDILQVSKETLKKYGAVSFEVAKQLCENVRKLFKSDIGISITGIAGPEGGTAEKPVGTVYIGISNEIKTKVEKFIFSGSRERIQKFTINFALNILRKEIL